MAVSTAAWFLEAQGVCKEFPGVRALDQVRLELRRGEVLAVVGENGAGKSTLMRILAGVEPADAGEIRIEGRPVRIASVDDAQRLGITLIHQELYQAESLDVAGNLFLGREPTWGGPLRLIHRDIYREAEQALARIGLHCSPRATIGQLPLGQRQLIEIARALSLCSRILIMDEPTASLSRGESDRLFGVIRDLAQRGVSIVYISHRLREVEEIADRVMVLRDGRNAGELEAGEIRHDAMVRLMVGRALTQFFPRSHRPTEGAPVALSVRGVRWSEQPRTPIHFELCAGEIVGLAGLVGAGRTELAETLFGLRRSLAGVIQVAGQDLAVRRPIDAIRAGLFLVPEDRRADGLMPEQSVEWNITVGSLDRLSWLQLIRRGESRELAEAMCRRHAIRTPTLSQPVGVLSGGNQQKVVLARWLCRTPRVLILDEPTRGVDVGAKAEIYALMDDLTRQGIAILMISSDLEEIIGLSDRVLVMHEGEIAGELAGDAIREESIMRLATGGDSRP